MSQYKIFNQTVEFDDAADRFCRVQFFAWDAAVKAQKEFDLWYTKCGNIHNVLKNYWDEVKKVVVDSTINPLHATLAKEYQIYNISIDSYRKACLDLSEAVDVYEKAVGIYNDIEDQLAEEREYREYRKASRGEVIGGGFGLGGAIKGMATAGAINMATGAAHGLVNAIGNAGSEGDATQRKKELYKQARKLFLDAIERCVLTTAFGHIDIVNENCSLQIQSSFDSDQGTALLDNAQIIPEKREELLVEAFRNCPWHHRLYPYIFENYPAERRNIIAISKDFHFDLSDHIEELLGKEYTPEAKKSEELAQAAKNRIKQIMLELGVVESKVIDEIETDCLERLCGNYSSLDESQCNKLLKEIDTYDALPKNKQVFVEKVEARIEQIWAKEDGDIFDNYLLNTDILNPVEVENGIKFIKERGRTNDAQKYLKAFSSFNMPQIKKVRRYRKCAPNTVAGYLLRNLGWIILGFGVIMLVALDEGSFWLQTVPLISGCIIQVYLSSLKSAWRTATVEGKVVHPVFTMGKDEFLKACINTANPKEEN